MDLSSSEGDDRSPPKKKTRVNTDCDKILPLMTSNDIDETPDYVLDPKHRTVIDDHLGPRRSRRLSDKSASEDEIVREPRFRIISRLTFKGKKTR